MTFRTLETASEHDGADMVEIFIDDNPVRARRGQNLAALMLTGTAGTFRASPVDGSARAPFCMMGSCFECLVEIDGLSNCQACLTPVRPGMRVRRQL
ncbi:(2Fe-2S)-binding protein [Limimaricola pyoseonensis]|uniref:2Fe-2S iron-sulfur cluster binding domain-containing protein n=1 Tax=Limimaricola pyoseonensis TaxID=521013 RepID=A0A1G7HU96_9RHOB|nr:(2Fe-2S)-binding protein [Limimaricola pyoseonensis]SDF03804.1 2Fe-2S iron-sulfur cluster binding domain-containing protein [Limimaricola pyoseonensis]